MRGVIIMKRNKFLKLISALVIAAASLSFTSCEDIINILLAPFGSLNNMSAVGLDESAYITWSNGAISNYSLSLNVSPAPSTGSYPRSLTSTERNNNYLIVEGLTNGTPYTFTLTLGNDSNTQLSATAIPSADAGYEHTYTGNAATSFVELENNVVAIRIKGATGKYISYANVNTNTSKAISASSVRRYVSASGSSGSLSPNIISRAGDGDSAEEEITAPKIRHFVPPAESSVKVIGSKSRSGGSNDTFNVNNPQIGQTRSIYVDQNVNLDTLGLETMKLYAIGYKPNGTPNEIACLVWAREQDVSDTGSSTKIKPSAIKDIAAKFVKYYQFEEEIFGPTSDELLTRNSTVSMTDARYAPTKNYVNIVLWDIGKDGTAGTCGVVGYFWAKDYYKSGVTQVASNEGKYFYIDIPFCNYNSDGTYTSSNTVSDTVISTLFHEYQHMINFNQKFMIAGHKNVDTWYNEMLSMLCEDLLDVTLGLGSGECVYDGRIPNFNSYYYYSGAAQYLESNSWISYATAYTFGAFLLRNYGGTALVSAMSKNNSVGIESVVAAVNSVNSTNLTWNDIMKEYVKACAFRPAYAKAKSIPTLYVNRTGSGWVTSKTVLNALVTYATNASASSPDNANVSGGTLSTYVDGINMWNDAYKPTSNNYGPLQIRIDAELDLQPTGFIIHPIGQASSDDVLLLFTSPTTSDEKVYIFIQDYASSTTEDTTSPAN